MTQTLSSDANNLTLLLQSIPGTYNSYDRKIIRDNINLTFPKQKLINNWVDELRSKNFIKYPPRPRKVGIQDLDEIERIRLQKYGIKFDLSKSLQFLKFARITIKRFDEGGRMLDQNGNITNDPNNQANEIISVHDLLSTPHILQRTARLMQAIRSARAGIMPLQLQHVQQNVLMQQAQIVAQGLRTAPQGATKSEAQIQREAMQLVLLKALNDLALNPHRFSSEDIALIQQRFTENSLPIDINAYATSSMHAVLFSGDVGIVGSMLRHVNRDHIIDVLQTAMQYKDARVTEFLDRQPNWFIGVSVLRPPRDDPEFKQSEDIQTMGDIAEETETFQDQRRDQEFMSNLSKEYKNTAIKNKEIFAHNKNVFVQLMNRYISRRNIPKNKALQDTNADDMFEDLIEYLVQVFTEDTPISFKDFDDAVDFFLTSEFRRLIEAGDRLVWDDSNDEEKFDTESIDQWFVNRVNLGQFRKNIQNYLPKDDDADIKAIVDTNYNTFIDFLSDQQDVVTDASYSYKEYKKHLTDFVDQVGIDTVNIERAETEQSFEDLPRPEPFKGEMHKIIREVVPDVSYRNKGKSYDQAWYTENNLDSKSNVHRANFAKFIETYCRNPTNKGMTTFDFSQTMDILDGIRDGNLRILNNGLNNFTLEKA